MHGLQRAGDVQCQVTLCRAEEKSLSQAFYGADRSWDTERTDSMQDVQEQTQGWEPQTVSSPDRATLE